MSVEDKTVVITGAASGLGEAWTRGFAADGATVIAADVNETGLEAIDLANVHSIRADVSVEDDVERMIEFAIERTGRVDVLFNNAGIGMNRPFLEIPEGEFERHVAIHLYGTVYGMRYALPHMHSQGHGRIINTISRAAEISGPKNAAYAAAKAGIFAATRSVQREFEDEDILINMLIPGPTNTAIWGRDMPQMQGAEVTYPTAKKLATLLEGEARGKVFWDESEYPLFGSLYES